jgi:hypothetical protein
MPPDAPESSTKRPRNQPAALPGFPITENLSTDDPHWRRTTLASVLLAATAAIGARHTQGPTRVILALAAVLCALPAVTFALMIAIALSHDLTDADQQRPKRPR